MAKYYENPGSQEEEDDILAKKAADLEFRQSISTPEGMAAYDKSVADRWSDIQNQTGAYQSSTGWFENMMDSITENIIKYGPPIFAAAAGGSALAGLGGTSEAALGSSALGDAAGTLGTTGATAAGATAGGSTAAGLGGLGDLMGGAMQVIPVTAPAAAAGGVGLGTVAAGAAGAAGLGSMLGGGGTPATPQPQPQTQPDPASSIPDAGTVTVGAPTPPVADPTTLGGIVGAGAVGAGAGALAGSGDTSIPDAGKVTVTAPAPTPAPISPGQIAAGAVGGGLIENMIGTEDKPAVVPVGPPPAHGGLADEPTPAPIPILTPGDLSPPPPSDNTALIPLPNWNVNPGGGTGGTVVGGTPGGSGGGTTGIGLPGGIGSILPGLGQIVGGLTDYNMNQHDKDYYQSLMDKMMGMYQPGTPEEELMRKKMEAQDAAAGRNSQYGTRAINLAGMLAQQRANIMTSPTFEKLAEASRGHYDSSLASLSSLFGNASTNGTPLNNLLGGLGSLFSSGDPSTATSSLFTPAAAPTR